MVGALHTMYYILVYTLAFPFCYGLFSQIGYQCNSRFQNLIYVWILVLCIDVVRVCCFSNVLIGYG